MYEQGSIWRSSHTRVQYVRVSSGASAEMEREKTASQPRLWIYTSCIKKERGKHEKINLHSIVVYLIRVRKKKSPPPFDQLIVVDIKPTAGKRVSRCLSCDNGASRRGK